MWGYLCDTLPYRVLLDIAYITVMRPPDEEIAEIDAMLEDDFDEDDEVPAEVVVDEPGVEPTVPEETTDILGVLVSKPVKTTARNIGLAEKIKPLVSSATLDHKNKLDELRTRIDRNEREAQSSLERVKEYQERAKRYATLAKNQAKELALEAEKTLPVVDTAPLVERLKRHKALQYVQVTATGALMLYYKPIWTMAQVEEDSKKRVRMFVGCFQVKLTPGEQVNAMVQNLTFPELGHWSVSGGRPCWGNWEQTIKDLWKRGAVYDIVTMMAAYLASNEDGAAYSRTYKFRDNRVNLVKRIGLTVLNENWEIDKYVIYDRNHTARDGRDLKGLPGITRRDGRTPSVYFLAPVDCYAYDYRNNAGRSLPHPHSRGYNINPSYVKLVTDDKVPELEAFLESVKSLSDEEQIEKLREWGMAFLAQEQEEQARVGKRLSLLAHLDSAESLEYARVAQPLVIDVTK